MLITLDILLWLAALIGHVCLWVTLFNWSHASGLPRRAVSILGDSFLMMLPLLPALLLVSGWWSPLSILQGDHSLTWWLRIAYLIACYHALLTLLPPWLAWRLRDRSPSLVSNHTWHKDAAADLGKPLAANGAARFLFRIRANQFVRPVVNEKVLRLPQLPAAWEGLSITHVSDFHFAGQVEKDYFDYVVDLANDLHGDLVAITGDLVDKTPLIEWIPSTLGRLQAPLGVYYVLGNHDRRIDHHRLRQTMNDCGCVHLGDRWKRIDYEGHPLVLAGTEAPWFGSNPNLDEQPPASGGLKLLLSHSPDTAPWARQAGFDLMLAGHTHGGQICLPGIGPLLTCSRLSTHYVTGVHFAPPTLLHTSRGVCGLQPIRLNCPPEITRLVLRGGSEG